MSLTPEELEEVEARAIQAVQNADDNEAAARIGIDVLMLLLVLKLAKEKTGARKR